MTGNGRPHILIVLVSSWSWFRVGVATTQKRWKLSLVSGPLQPYARRHRDRLRVGMLPRPTLRNVSRPKRDCETKISRYAKKISKASMFEEIVGASPALQTVLSRIAKVAPAASTVLITGETGTGKELVARAIHRRSQRCSRPFVSVNCAAIPRDLIASELFGHEKGAFTGALQRRLGKFELAEGGTSSWTRSANFQQKPRSRCCEFCRSTNLSVSAAIKQFEPTFG